MASFQAGTIDGAWVLCACGGRLFVRELREHLQAE
jgi:hypothetical protein